MRYRAPIYVGILIVVAGWPVPALAQSTIVVIVRHAEKELGTGDVGLSEAGRKRSAQLATIARTLRVSTVYSTSTARALQTATPAASSLGISPIMYGDATRPWANQIVSGNSGRTVLIIGHSNTIPVIVRHFGGGAVTVPDQDFDKLFLLEVKESETSVVETRYGESESTTLSNDFLKVTSDSQSTGKATWFDTPSAHIHTDVTINGTPDLPSYGPLGLSPAATIFRELSPSLDVSGSPMVRAFERIKSEKWQDKRVMLADEPNYAANIRSLLERSILAGDRPQGMLRNSGPDFIIGDPDTNRDMTDEFRTTVFLGRDDSESVCSGVLIAPNVVLTAKHCVVSGRDYAYFGRTLFPPDRTAYINIVGSPIFHDTHDIALVKLERPVDFPHAELADENSLRSYTDVTVAGYGFSVESSATFRSGSGAGIRRRATVPIRSYLLTDEDASKFKAKRGFEFVAGGTLAGAACYGDSGGPCYVPTPNGWKVIGITSGGIPEELWEHPDKACGNGARTVRVEQAEIQLWIKTNLARL